jgi:uncharacterized glyoxalase superfamily metalloenzyme YdcJ
MLIEADSSAAEAQAETLVAPIASAAATWAAVLQLVTAEASAAGPGVSAAEPLVPAATAAISAWAGEAEVSAVVAEALAVAAVAAAGGNES